MSPDTITETREWLLALAATTLLFVLPGWALLRRWRGAAWLTLTEQLILGLGVGMALYPCVILALHLLGLQVGPALGWALPLLALPLLLWSYRRPVAPLPNWRAREPGGAFWPGTALLIVTGGIVGVRCLAVRGLEVPLWGDSVHHAMIAQLIVDHQGLFRSWEPYAALQTFTYHFGFHAHAAAIVWMTGIATPRAVVIIGQIANIAAVLAIYPLALRLGRSRWAGIAALLLAGLLAPMPMLYVHWGRYTQLAGQVMLPVAVYLAWRLLEAPRREWRLLLIASITFAGLVLTHYRIAIFALCFFPAVMVVCGWGSWREWALRLGLLALLSGGLAAPWLLRVLGGQLPVVLGSIVAASATRDVAAPGADSLNVMGGPLFFLPAPVWYALPVALLWAVWRRNRAVLAVALWWLLALLLVNPHVFGLPGAGTLTNFTWLIAAYIPAGLILGALAGGLPGRISRPGLLAALTLGVAGLAWWGGAQRLQQLDLTTTAMVEPADLRAFEWIRRSTPAEARFLVNGFFPNPEVVVGSDGGWWLPLLARRETTLPPILYIAEHGPRPDYRMWINELYAAVHDLGITHPRTIARLRERGVTHVYLGQRGGTVGYGGGEQIIAPEALLGNAAFRLVYHEDQVWIFALQPAGKDHRGL
ncbi:MAG: hypothetical protein RMK84_04680 [Oscillochloridaceae bacterium]|nr:hypothetical protein [Chloroflexaceae bacterium]MDW8389399.1 hypothetical protein [Oscillochloridaceae bacterium]